MEILWHLIVFFVAAGSAGLDRNIYPIVFLISLIGGVYFLGWGAVITAFIGLIAGIKGLADQKKKKNPSTAPTERTTSVESVKPMKIVNPVINTNSPITPFGEKKQSETSLENQLKLQAYKQLTKELDQKIVDKSLWLMAEVEANGDVSKIKIIYSKYRVDQISERMLRERSEQEREKFELIKAEAYEKAGVEKELLIAEYNTCQILELERKTKEDAISSIREDEQKYNHLKVYNEFIAKKRFWNIKALCFWILNWICILLVLTQPKNGVLALLVFGTGIIAYIYSFKIVYSIRRFAKYLKLNEESVVSAFKELNLNSKNRINSSVSVILYLLSAIFFIIIPLLLPLILFARIVKYKKLA